jgi:hypothetical protein
MSQKFFYFFIFFIFLFFFIFYFYFYFYFLFFIPTSHPPILVGGGGGGVEDIKNFLCGVVMLWVVERQALSNP